MVAPGRVELPTFGLGNRCSIHLSYGAVGVAFKILHCDHVFLSSAGLISSVGEHSPDSRERLSPQEAPQAGSKGYAKVIANFSRYRLRKIGVGNAPRLS